LGDEALYSGRLPDFDPDLLVAGLGLYRSGRGCAGRGLHFVAIKTWRQILDTTGSLWAVALSTALGRFLPHTAGALLWEPVTRLTFTMVKFMLSWILPGTTTDAAHATIHAPHFSVIIAPECSGLEGAALILVFMIAWLWLFRQESRFPWALGVASRRRGCTLPSSMLFD